MVVAQLEQVFDAAGVTGFVHAHEIGLPDRCVSLNADDRVVLASVFKIAVSVAFWRKVAEGTVDPSRTVNVSADYRRGGTGVAGCHDDVVASLRDLAGLMMTLSDNAATDVIMDAVGMDAVNAVLADLGLNGTAIAGRTRDDMDQERSEIRAMGGCLDVDHAWDDLPEEMLLRLSTVDPTRTGTYSTPRDVTRLLDAVWSDRAAPPSATAAVRRAMSRQIYSHRLASGFDSSYRVSGKTGSLEGIRNEAGVVTTYSGQSFAVAIFLRSQQAAAHNPPLDAVIGRAARICVDHLTAATVSSEK